MELEDFVATSLRQIIKGIQKAQAEPGGENVNAAFRHAELAGNLMHAQDDGMFTRVDFDVAVTAETAGKAGAGVKVWSVGFDAGASHTQNKASRISFSVPVRLPDGDRTRVDRNRESDRRSYEEMNRNSDTDWRG